MFATVFAVAAFFTSAVVAAPSPMNGGGASSSTSTTTIANVPQVNECNYTGGMVCCNSLDFTQGSIEESLLSVCDVPIDLDLLVGHGCSPLIGLNNQCNGQAACCEKTYSGIGVNCNNMLLF